MYEMLTGRVPFDSDTSVSVALKHMQEPPVPPMEVNNNIPKAVNDIILKSNAKRANGKISNCNRNVKRLSKSIKRTRRRLCRRRRF